MKKLVMLAVAILGTTAMVNAQTTPVKEAKAAKKEKKQRKKPKKQKRLCQKLQKLKNKTTGVNLYKTSLS
jgi:hypothetical protein